MENKKHSKIRLYVNNEDIIIRQSNSLVEARYKLSLNEHKIILMMMSLIKKDDPEFTDVDLRVQDFIDAIDSNHKDVYKDIQKFARGLKHKDIELEDEQEWFLTGWISSFRYFKKKGIIRLKFSEELRPWLLEQLKRFTKVQLQYALHLRSYYSIRIYLLLKQYYPRIPERTFEIEELRGILGVKEHMYKTFGQFTRRVIFPAQRDLKTNADVAFEFESIKTVGKKIGRIKFIIRANMPKPKQCILVLPPSHVQLIEQSQEEENRKTEYYNALPDEKKNEIEMQIDERIVKENPAYSDNLRNDNDPVLRNMRYVYRVEIIGEINKKAASI